MPRNITVTFQDGTNHVYQNAPDDITPEAVSARAQQEFGKPITSLDGGRAVKEPTMLEKSEGYVRPLLEGGGMLAGGVAGAPAGPVGGVVGGGLGYAAGKNVADMIYSPASNTTDALQTTAGDVVQGAAMSAGGEVLGKVLPAVAGAVGKGTQAVWGKLTGKGSGAIQEAIKSGTDTGMSLDPLKSKTAFDKAMRGEITGDEIVDYAKFGLSKLKDARGQEYVSKLDKIKLDRTAQTGIMSKMADKVKELTGKEAFDIKPVTDNKGKIVDFDFSESTLVENQPVIAKALKDLSSWRDYSASGLDILKKRIGQYADQVKAGTPQESFLTNLKTTLSDGLKENIPQYAEMTKGYSEATTLIKDLEAGLMLRKQGMSGRIVADQTLKRLTSAMQNDATLRRDLISSLSSSAPDLSGAIAGNAMSGLTPGGLAGSGPALIGGGALTALNPGLWPLLAASSPRISGEFLRLVGKTLPGLKGVGPLVGQGIAYGATDKTQNVFSPAPTQNALAQQGAPYGR